MGREDMHPMFSEKKIRIKFEDEEWKPTNIEGSGRRYISCKDKKGAV